MNAAITIAVHALIACASIVAIPLLIDCALRWVSAFNQLRKRRPR